MADNYLQFSECLDALTREEAEWLHEQLAENPDRGCPRFLLDLSDREADDCDCGFQYDFQELPQDRCLWLSAEERGDVQRVAHFVQKFLRRFRPDQCWSLTYATTCSTLRLGEFGGGAVFVTPDEICHSDCYGFVEDKRQAFNRRQTAEPQPTSELHSYGLRVDVGLLARQQGLLAELTDKVRQGQPYLSLNSDTEGLLEGVLNLLDGIADQVRA
jgi:hypothetical protein